jgi:hypothetical protein
MTDFRSDDADLRKTRMSDKRNVNCSLAEFLV